MANRRKNLAILLVSELGENASPDDMATLEQASDIAGALTALGFSPETLPFRTDLARIRKELESRRPAIVVNLVETLFGGGNLVHIAPALLEQLGIPFLGSGSSALFMTSHKLCAKRIMRACRIPTPDWLEAPRWEGLNEGTRYIVKCANEDASVGIDAKSVVSGRKALLARVHRAEEERPGIWFAEEYVEGREFNVTLIEGPEGPEVMPLAEMTFIDYPPDRPRIIDYEAKWMEGTFAFENTKRRFIDEAAEAGLAHPIRKAACDAWNAFGLRGWARVDFRIDEAGNPFAIDVNANPDLTDGIGVAAAAARAGIAYKELVGRIVERAIAHYEARA